MKVYSFIWDAGGYGSGLMFIAANNPIEAINLAKQDREHWYFSAEIPYLKVDENLTKPFVIDSDYYQE